LRRGIEAGLLNEQDEYGMTALHLAVSSGWLEGIEELLRAGADIESRYFRTGETPLLEEAQGQFLQTADI
jgi:ankyrin repeat protein